jgi:hypothetical protein
MDTKLSWLKNECQVKYQFFINFLFDSKIFLCRIELARRKIMGELSVLNVAAGDIKLTFDTNDAVEAIRAKRMISDMLRRGYALLIEVDGKFQRALEFKEDVGEYIVADFDPSGPALKPQITHTIAEEIIHAENETKNETSLPKAKSRGRKAIPMEKAKAVAVGRSAGG